MARPAHPESIDSPKGMSYCFKCQTHKPKEEFGILRRRPSGLNYYCRACMRVRFLDFAEKRTPILLAKRKALKEQIIKEMGGKCYRCGYNEFISSLEFHHQDPAEKKDTLSNLLTAAMHGGEERMRLLREEVAKCKLICTNCHRGIHNDLSPNPLTPPSE